MQKNIQFRCLLGMILGLFAMSCSSPLKVNQQAYAKLSQEKTFEASFPEVWKAIEETVRKFKVISRDPETVSPAEMKLLKKRDLETDWIYSQSRDKYHTYKVNGLPRKIYLQTRIKYQILASQTMGGVNVQIKTQEEVERLDSDGSTTGYESVDAIDTSRGNEILEKIKIALL